MTSRIFRDEVSKLDVIGYFPERKAVWEEKVWIIILAAGASSRMGTSKSLLPINGDSMIRTIVRKAIQSGSVGVVLKRGAKSALNQVMDLPVVIIHPPTDLNEMSDSFKAAIQFCQKMKAEAAIILLGDQPDIQPEVIDQLISALLTTKKPIIQPVYLDGPGHPILFKKTLFSELLSLTGDQGAKGLLKKNKELIERLPINNLKPVDLDTPEEYFSYLNKKL